MPERTLTCPQCALKFVSRRTDGERTLCYRCVPPSPAEVATRGTPCERCGRPSRGSRCSRCKVIVPCSCGCGVEAHLSSSDYGNPGATARANKCLTRGVPATSSGRCEECGTSFVPYPPKMGRPPQRFCSVKCSGAYAGRTLAKRDNTHTCEECGEVFHRRKSGGPYVAKFCSRACADAAKRTGRKPSQPLSQIRSKVYFRDCRVCGALFCSKVSRGKYCSDMCRARRSIDRTMRLYELATMFDKDTGRYAGAEWRRVLLDYLVQRDGDKCAICSRKVNLNLKSGPKGSRRGPSIDHIIPRSLGGSDDLANLRLTHWGCNQKRGNRGGNEQLALVG